MWPPKPRLLDSATFCLRPEIASCTTATAQSGSASANPQVGGTQSLATDSAVTMASSAPAAPSVWPSEPLTDVTGMREPASSPASAMSACDSVESLAGVPVPWAFRCPISSGAKPPSASACSMARRMPSPSGEGAVMW